MTTIAVGTEKGAYLVRDDGDGWDVTGPLHEGWRVTAFGRAPDGRALLAVASNWFGCSLHVSADLEEWEQVGAPAWPEGSDRTLEQVWTLHTIDDTVYAGVAEAGLFRSTDLTTWEPVTGLNEHPTRQHWQPGLGGLCAHRVLDDGGGRLWVAISSVGLMRSDDGGDSFRHADEGVVAAVDPEEGAEARGWCVHGVVNDPADPDRIWRQDHAGVYRTSDGGDSWERIDASLPNEAGFGFAIARDHDSGRLFLAPLHSDRNRTPVDGSFAVWASDDDGDSWQVSGTGWPDAPSYQGVLRGAIDTDHRGTVAIGTTSGQVWATRDVGERWQQLPGTFPRINSVAVWGEP